MTLSNKDRSRLNRAMKAAGLSEAKQKHGAVIYVGGSLMSVGINVVKNSPIYVGDACIDPKRHAETAAIRACGTDVDLSNAVIYVARINRTGEPLMSKPCTSCQEAIKAVGIKRVVYTIDHSLDL